MNWQERLITIYLYVCKYYQNTLWVYSQHLSNYADLSFTDEVRNAAHINHTKEEHALIDRRFEKWLLNLR